MRRGTMIAVRNDMQSPWEGICLLLATFVLFFVAGKVGVGSVGANIETAATLGGAVIAGLLASVSTCLALVGGLLLSVSASYAQATKGKKRRTRIVPVIGFNAGRLASYILLGGLIGYAGKALMPSVHATGIVTLILAAVMLVTGLGLLRIVPKKFCTIPLPQGMVQRLRELTRSRRRRWPRAALRRDR